MSLQVIKELKDRVEKAEEKVKTAEDVIAQVKKEYEDNIAELKKEFEERKAAYAAGLVAKDPDAVARAKKDGANLYLKSIILGKPVTEFKEFKQISQIVEKAIKPDDVTDWLGEEFSKQILDKLNPELKVEGLFQKLRFPANVSQYSFPALIDNSKAYLIAPDEDAIKSAIGAAKITYETKRLKTLIGVTDQANQETVTALADVVKQRLVTSLAKGSEEAIVLGKDKDDGYDSNDVREAFTGLMKLARDASQTYDNGGQDITAKAINEARKLMGVYGMNVTDLAIICDFKTAYDMLELPEVVTVEKFGSDATIVKGEIGKLWGMPIIVSGFMSNGNEGRFTTDGEDKESSDATHRALLVVNRNYFGVADRGQIGIEVQRNAVSSTNLYVGFRDVDFKNMAVGATPVAAVVNID